MATDIYIDTVYIPLQDVESEHCALIVEKGLAQVEGLESYHVELNNHRVAIVPKNREAVINSVQAIKDLGYGVSTLTKTFPVLGMTCASCASSAESMVKYEQGVLSSSVNFATGNLTVEYLPNVTDLFKIQKAVQADRR